MSLKATSLAAASVALLLTVAAAYPAKDDDSFYYSRLHDYNKDGRSWDGIDPREEQRPMYTLLAKLDQDLEAEKGSSNLLRDLDLLRNRAAFFSRGSRDQLDETKKQQAYHFMDPLMGNTIGTAKRAGCCDSLSGLGIGNQKRNMDEIDRSSFNGFIKKNFDEIDRSGFGSFVKKNFDEIDRSNFGGFVKRSVAPEIPRN